MNLNVTPAFPVSQRFPERSEVQRFWKFCLAGCLLVANSAFAQYSAVAAGTGIFESTGTPGPARYHYGIEDSHSSISHSITFTTDPVASIKYEGTVVNKSNVMNLDVRGGGTMAYDFYVTSSPFARVPVVFEGIFSSSFAKVPDSYPAPGNAYLQTLFGIGSADANDERSEFQATLGYFLPYDPDIPQFMPSVVGNLTYSVNLIDPMKVVGSFRGLALITTNADGYGVGTVNMIANGSILMSSGKFLSGSAFIDPRLEIAPEFLAVNPGSTLSIAPGVGNQVASIPEPSTYALMLAGLGPLILGARRKALVGPKPSGRSGGARI